MTCGGCAGVALSVFAAWTSWSNWSIFPTNLKLVVAMTIFGYFWEIIFFWIAEFVLWKSQLLCQFELTHASCCNWLVIVLFSPILFPLSNLCFYIIPTIDCLLHVTFVGELNYICAPKGDQQRKGKVIEFSFDREQTDANADAPLLKTDANADAGGT